MSLRLCVAAAAVVLLGACSANRHCVGEFDYQKAQTLAAPAEVAGLKLPESPSALRIPPPPPGNVPYANTVPDPEEPGETRVECLDVPPRLPVEAAPAPAATQAPPPAKS